jgi:hypothetical protein
VRARVIVAGSRSWNNRLAVWDALDRARQLLGPLTVVHGAARGADSLAATWVRARPAADVDEDPHPADWDTCAPDCPPGHRKRKGNREWCPTAGHRRNQAMVDVGADLLLAFPLPSSTGTWDCWRRAQAAGIRCVEIKAQGRSTR